VRDLRELSRVPIVVAPMAGGSSTAALVIATAEAGALAFLAAGYQSVEVMSQQLAEVRAGTQQPFGVNLFLPQPRTTHLEVVNDYLNLLEPDAERLGVSIDEPSWDDDGWDAKVEAILAEPPAVVSFTFGCPDAEVVQAFQALGITVVVTVTGPTEAEQAVAAGADAVCAQGIEAGGHRGTFTDVDDAEQDLSLLELIATVQAATDLPIIGAGGIGDPDRVRAVLDAGGVAAQVGTAFLRCPEAGTNATHRDALTDERFTATGITRAFSGRRARGLVNDLMRAHPDAPSAYPEIANATRSLRGAAAASGDPDRLHLWAGDAWRTATDCPAAEVVAWLAGRAE
jgi:nitronate monooxygenase